MGPSTRERTTWWTSTMRRTPPTPSGGLVTVTSDVFNLPTTEVQAVRVNLRWTPGGATVPSFCSGTEFDDVDDLVFVVEKSSLSSGSNGPLHFASMSKPPEPVKPLALPQVDCAIYTKFKWRCEAAAQCIWSGTECIPLPS